MVQPEGSEKIFSPAAEMHRFYAELNQGRQKLYQAIQSLADESVNISS